MSVLADTQRAIAKAQAGEGGQHAIGLLDVVALRPGWAWQPGRARHVGTDLQVVVDTRMGEDDTPSIPPYLVPAVEGDGEPVRFGRALDAVVWVEQHGEPRYTLAEADAELRRLACITRGRHSFNVTAGDDGTPTSVGCDDCNVSWALAPAWGEITAVAEAEQVWVGGGASTMTVMLDNSAGRFTPDVSALPYLPGGVAVPVAVLDRLVSGWSAAKGAPATAGEVIDQLVETIATYGGAYPGMRIDDGGLPGTLGTCDECKGAGLVFDPDDDGGRPVQEVRLPGDAPASSVVDPAVSDQRAGDAAAADTDGEPAAVEDTTAAGDTTAGGGHTNDDELAAVLDAEAVDLFAAYAGHGLDGLLDLDKGQRLRDHMYEAVQVGVGVHPGVAELARLLDRLAAATTQDEIDTVSASFEGWELQYRPIPVADWVDPHAAQGDAVVDAEWDKAAAR